MFESQPQSEINALLQSDSEFRRLYRRHQKLDKQVADALVGALPMAPSTVAQMKREKLATKERLLRWYEQRRVN
ncbi:YdcH family protein [Xanthomonadaceae bacterium JHOS43]|jgi:uncharacterized protein YdcH (DUF465 family)|nr:YdcH family protein [Xanthomonadaceae bacterium JHOS43]MCX7562981.1 YdcH family protein [Xanthomonadaceae bacterium XH05]